LRYIGGGAFLPGVPARDLSADECKFFDVKMLLASGIYEDLYRRKPKKQQEPEPEIIQEDIEEG
jgi:hypothetical protein